MICIEFEYENVNKTIFWWPWLLMLITSSYMETDAELALSHSPKTHSVLGGQKAAVLAQTNWNKEC